MNWGKLFRKKFADNHKTDNTKIDDKTSDYSNYDPINELIKKAYDNSITNYHDLKQLHLISYESEKNYKKNLGLLVGHMIHERNIANNDSRNRRLINALVRYYYSDFLIRELSKEDMKEYNVDIPKLSEFEVKHFIGCLEIELQDRIYARETELIRPKIFTSDFNSASNFLVNKYLLPN